MNQPNSVRRRILGWLGAAAGLLAFDRARAHHTDTHFEDSAKHRIVYQCNKADPDYFAHVLFSAGELIRKHGDDVQIVVAAFGPGLQLLGAKPSRPVAQEHQQRAASLAAYGVAFHACGNTMQSLQWTKKDLLAFTKVVPIGVEDIMLLQEQGFSYFSW